jgi:hypothetical protein
MLACIVFAVVAAISSCSAQQQAVKLSSTVIEGRTKESCPSTETLSQARNITSNAVQTILRDTVVPTLNFPPCSCGGDGEWRRVAHLDMTDTNQQCPPNWNLVTSPVRACDRSSTGNGCDSATFTSNDMPYSRVCGRVIAYQVGTPDAYHPSFWHHPGLERVYVDGLSLTHGAAGSRQHIWTFAAARYERSTDTNNFCACTNTAINWPHQSELPSFIGNSYFCDTGDREPPSIDGMLYQDDPLWDGDGCGPTSTCCQFNNPPWFCATLPEPTTDDVELRICMDDNQENAYVELVDIFVM